MQNDHLTSKPRHARDYDDAAYLGQYQEYDLWLVSRKGQAVLEADAGDTGMSSPVDAVGPRCHPALTAAWELADKRMLLKPTEAEQPTESEQRKPSTEQRLRNVESSLEDLLDAMTEEATEPAGPSEAIIIARMDVARHIMSNLTMAQVGGLELVPGGQGRLLHDAAAAFLVRQFEANIQKEVPQNVS